MRKILFLIVIAAGLSACSTAALVQSGGGQTSAKLTEPGLIWDQIVEVKNLSNPIRKAQKVPYEKMHVIGKKLKLPGGGSVRFFSVNGEKVFGGIISPRDKVVAVKCRNDKCTVLSPSSDKTVLNKQRAAALALFLVLHVAKPSWLTGAKSSTSAATPATSAPTIPAVAATTPAATPVAAAATTGVGTGFTFIPFY